MCAYTPFFSPQELSSQSVAQLMNDTPTRAQARTFGYGRRGAKTMLDRVVFVFRKETIDDRIHVDQMENVAQNVRRTRVQI